ncbi:MAG: MFS transporter [Actinomycetales bacterium]|nr:MFS transporter [Actinomycetales bacterium]
MLNPRKLFAPGAIFSFRDFRRVFLSSTLMSVGGGALPMAVAIVIIDSGGNATTLGLVMAARTLSFATFVMVGGVWADRIKRKYVMMAADLSRGLLVIALVLVSGDNSPRYLMGLILFLIGIGDAFGGPASGAIMTSILPENLLKQGNVFRGAVSRMGGIIGPAIGVASVALIGARLTFLISAVTCFGSFLMLSGVKESAHVQKEAHEPVWIEIKEGIKTVREMPWVGALILMATFQLMVVIASENVLLPIITKREFHTNTVMAMATTSFAIGGTVASILSLKIKTKAPGRFTLFTWSLFAFVPFALAYQQSEILIVIAYILAGISVGPWDAFWPSALQREVPKEKQGRVFALDHAGSVGMMPLGMALTGPVVSTFGEKQFLIFAGIFHLVVNLIVYRVPGVKEMKTPANSSKSEQD